MVNTTNRTTHWAHFCSVALNYASNNQARTKRLRDTATFVVHCEYQRFCKRMHDYYYDNLYSPFRIFDEGLGYNKIQRQIQYLDLTHFISFAKHHVPSK